MHYSETASAESFDDCLPRRLGGSRSPGANFSFFLRKKNLCYDTMVKKNLGMLFCKI